MFTVTLSNNLKLLTTPTFNRIKRGEKQCSIHILKYYTATGTNYCFSQQHEYQNTILKEASQTQMNTEKKN